MSNNLGTLLTLAFALVVTLASCYVVSSDPQSKGVTESLPVTNSSYVTNSKSSTHHAAADSQLVNPLGRQEVGEAIVTNVNNILIGLLTGNLGNIFQGGSDFIRDNDAKQEVDSVLNNVALPIDTVLKLLQQYFKLGGTTVSPSLNATQNPNSQILWKPVIHENGTVLQYIPIYVPVTMPPTQQVPVITTTKQGEGDEDEN